MSEHHPEAVVAEVLDNPLECTCEYVDIGVGHQKVAETPDCPRCTAWGMACAIVKALHDAGHLLPVGGESREVFDVQARGCHWPGFESEAAAWAQLAKVKAWPDKPKVRVVRRTITVWPDGRRHVSPDEYVGGDVIEGVVP